MNFPKELAALPQWICWRLEPDPKSEKPRKVPYDPKTGRKASSTNPQTWATLAEAEAARAKYLFTGVGFVFTEVGGIVGVDIDHCKKEDGSWNEVASAILTKYPSYTEISPSGTGLHIFYRGTMPGKGNKNSQSAVEMYAAARYFTMTCNRLEGTPEDIADGTEALPWIHETYVAKKKAAKSKAKRAVRTVSLTDEQVLEKATSAQNGEDFTALWEGRWQEKFDSQSEADLALCCALAFWTGRNREQMDRLFRQSKLFREKWDNVHHNVPMTAKEYLSQAYRIDQRINAKLMRISELRALAQKCTVAYGGERVSHTRNVASLEDSVMKIMEAEKELDAQIDLLVDTKKEIEGVIERVPDADCRLLLEMRYLAMESWTEIARQMNTYRMRVYRLHDKSLELVAEVLQQKGVCADA